MTTTTQEEKSTKTRRASLKPEDFAYGDLFCPICTSTVPMRKMGKAPRVQGARSANPKYSFVQRWQCKRCYKSTVNPLRRPNKRRSRRRDDGE